MGMRCSGASTWREVPREAHTNVSWQLRAQMPFSLLVIPGIPALSCLWEKQMPSLDPTEKLSRHRSGAVSDGDLQAEHLPQYDLRPVGACRIFEPIAQCRG